MTFVIHATYSYIANPKLIHQKKGAGIMLKRFKFSLAWKFILPVVFVLIFSMGMAGGITYLQMGKTLNDQMQKYVASNMNGVQQVINDNNSIYNLAKNQMYNDLAVKAKAIAEIVSSNPDVLTNERLQTLTKVLGVDEIYISDEKGLIKYSTVPQFIGYDFNSADQSRPFMKALTDKNFVLVQDPLPRGADKVLFQYAGVARQDMPGIIQVGVQPKTMGTLLDSISLDAVINNTSVGEGGYVAITDLNGVTMYHKDKSVIGKSFKELGIPVDLTRESGELKYNFKGQAKYLQYKKLDNYFLIIVVPQSQFLGALQVMLVNVGLLVVVSVLLSILIIVLFVRQAVLVRIKALVNLINKTAKFDLAYDNSYEYLLKYSDEVGTIVRSVAEMRSALRRIIGNIRNESANILSNSQSLAAATNQATASSEEVARAVEELAKGASEQAREAQGSSEKLMVLSDEIDIVSAKSGSIEEETNQVNELNKAGKEALNGLKAKLEENTVIAIKVGDQIDKLANESGSVGQIVDTIQGIAARTNLLALNAAIEAARAGEAGSGFAVVADEIRKLAEQTSASTKEISEIVSQIQKEIDQAKSNMDSAGVIVAATNEGILKSEKAFDIMSEAIQGTIKDILILDQSIRKINESKNTVVASIQEISAISEEAAASTEEVSASIEEQSSTMEDISSTAESLKDIAQNLEASVKEFKV